MQVAFKFAGCEVSNCFGDRGDFALDFDSYFGGMVVIGIDLDFHQGSGDSVGFCKIVDDFRFNFADSGRAEFTIPDNPDGVEGVSRGGRREVFRR